MVEKHLQGRLIRLNRLPQVVRFGGLTQVSLKASARNRIDSYFFNTLGYQVESVIKKSHSSISFVPFQDANSNLYLSFTFTEPKDSSDVDGLADALEGTEITGCYRSKLSNNPTLEAEFDYYDWGWCLKKTNGRRQSIARKSNFVLKKISWPVRYKKQILSSFGR